MGRFAAEDIHWHPENMIYGDRLIQLPNAMFLPDMLAIRQRGNSYGYCIGNPFIYKDENGAWANWVAGAIGGFVYGAGSVLVGDIISGEWSGWETYVGEAVGGAVGGSILLGTGSVSGAAAAQAIVSNGLTAGLEVASGKDVEWGAVAINTGLDIGINIVSFKGATKLCPRGPGRPPKYWQVV